MPETAVKVAENLWDYYHTDDVADWSRTWPVSRVMDTMMCPGTKRIEFAKPSQKGPDYVDIRMSGECHDGLAEIVVRINGKDCTEAEISRMQDILLELYPKGTGPNFMLRKRVLDSLQRLQRGNK